MMRDYIKGFATAALVVTMAAVMIARMTSTPPPCDRVCCVEDLGLARDGGISLLQTGMNRIVPGQSHTCRVDTVPHQCKISFVRNDTSFIVDCPHKAGE